MSAESDLLQQGIEQLDTGDRRGAAKIFVRLLRRDPQIENAWWWLSACVETEQQKRDCLQRILELNPWNEEARAALDQLDFTLPDPLQLAQSAELNRDYASAHQYYAQAVEDNPACVAGWLGRGFSAGMLSNPTKNGLREFFNCLGKALRASGMATADLQGTALAQMATRLTHDQLHSLIGYLQTLFDYTTGLAERCSPNMANIYAAERVHLADWVCYMQQLAGEKGEGIYTREKLIYIVVDAYTRIASNIRQTTRGPRSRQELLGNFKFFLLSNLSLSKLSQDSQLHSWLDKIMAQSVQ
jgi:tetratricopeptide (TPR) repeat protein